MKNRSMLFLIPLIGYIGLWLLGSLFFLIYFKIFNVSMDLDNNAMIQHIPPLLSIITVPVCSFISFFITSKVILNKFTPPIGNRMVCKIAGFSVLLTVGLDILITVIIQQINILLFPVNLMYLFAWLIIVPSSLLANHRRQCKKENS